jgi:hypothetical protein
MSVSGLAQPHWDWIKKIPFTKTTGPFWFRDAVSSSDGSIYITAVSDSASSGKYNSELLKLNASGVCLWKKKIPDTSIKDVETDDSGNLYISGLRTADSINKGIISCYSNTGILKWQSILPKEIIQVKLFNNEVYFIGRDTVRDSVSTMTFSSTYLGILSSNGVLQDSREYGTGHLYFDNYNYHQHLNPFSIAINSYGSISVVGEVFQAVVGNDTVKSTNGFRSFAALFDQNLDPVSLKAFGGYAGYERYKGVRAFDDRFLATGQFTFKESYVLTKMINENGDLYNEKELQYGCNVYGADFRIYSYSSNDGSTLFLGVVETCKPQGRYFNFYSLTEEGDLVNFESAAVSNIWAEAVIGSAPSSIYVVGGNGEPMTIGNISSDSTGYFIARYEITPLASEDIQADNQVSVYPNPACLVVTCHTSDGYQVSGLYDLKGKLLKEINSVEPSVKIGVDDIPAGIYFLKFTSPEGSINKKLVLCK